MASMRSFCPIQPVKEIKSFDLLYFNVTFFSEPQCCYLTETKVKFNFLTKILILNKICGYLCVLTRSSESFTES